MKLFVAIGDCHLDLTTDGISRNTEIRRVMLHAVNYAVENAAHYFIFNGDVFDNNTPSDEAIAVFLECLSILDAHGIMTYVCDGNHEKKHRGKPSCLYFISKIKAFKYVRVIHDIRGIRINPSLYLIFFPHVNKPNIPKKFKTPQDYVEHRAERFVKKLDFFSQVLVFSHLNVKGVVPGTEEHMLKKSEVYLPDCFHTKNYLDKPHPIVINSHIHTAQKSGWAQIIGSPIFCSFGEKEKKKFFAAIRVQEKEGDDWGIELIPSPCGKFHEFVFDVREPKKFEMEKQARRIIEKIGKRDYVKISVTGPESVLDLGWEAMRLKIMKHCKFVKPIRPTVSRVRSKRNLKQKLNLNPKDAVLVFLKANKPKNVKAVLRVADRYLREIFE